MLAHPIIIVEGIFVLALPQILECLDLKVYVEATDDLRLNRRIIRDAKEKLRSESSLIQEWQANVMPTHEDLVGPGAAMADLVVLGEGDVGESVGRVLVISRLQQNTFT